MKNATLALLAALACQTVLAQNQPSMYVQTVCLKVDPAKTTQYESFVRETVVKAMKALVQSGDVQWFVFSRSVVPSGEAATCDYIGATGTRGFPPGPAQSMLAQGLAKGGVNMTVEQYLARLSSLRRQVTSAMLVTVAGAGEIAEGDYYQVVQLKTKPGQAAAWRELETKVWKPIQEERVKAGKLKGWRVYARTLPGGSSQPFDGVAVNIYPSWAAQGQPSGMNDALKKVHPNLTPQQFGEMTNAVRDLVNTELRQAIIVMGDAKM